MCGFSSTTQLKLSLGMQMDPLPHALNMKHSPNVPDCNKTGKIHCKLSVVDFAVDTGLLVHSQKDMQENMDKADDLSQGNPNQDQAHEIEDTQCAFRGTYTDRGYCVSFLQTLP